jgi:hypothetical protein
MALLPAHILAQKKNSSGLAFPIVPQIRVETMTIRKLNVHTVRPIDNAGEKTAAGRRASKNEACGQGAPNKKRKGRRPEAGRAPSKYYNCHNKVMQKPTKK